MSDPLEIYLPQVSTTTAKRRRSRAPITYNWSDEEIVTLISAVHERDILWRPTHESYKSIKKKNRVWRNIFENVFDSRISVKELISKWTNLRVQYKTYSLKYYENDLMPDSEPIKKWRFFNNLNFLSHVISNVTPVSRKKRRQIVVPETKKIIHSIDGDEFSIFGQFVASEIRRLSNDYHKQKLKRLIQSTIINYNEEIEGKYV